MRVRLLLPLLAVIAVGHLSDCGTSEAGLRTDQPHALANACPSSIYTGTVSSYNLVAERVAVLTHSYTNRII